MFIASIFEAMTIGAVMPFIGILTFPEHIYDYSIAKTLANILHFREPRQLLMPITVLFCGAALVSGALRITLLWMQTQVSFGIGSDLSNEIYKRTLHQSYATHVSRNSSEFVSAIYSKAQGIVQVIVLPVLTILSSAMILVSVLSVLIVVDPKVAFLSMFSFGLVYLSIVLMFRRSLLLYSSVINQNVTNVLKILQEGLGGIRDVIIGGTQNYFCSLYTDANLKLVRALSRIQFIASAPRYVIEPLGIILISLFALELALNSGGVIAAMPIIGALAIGAQRLLPLFQQVFASWAQIRGNTSLLLETVDLLDQPMKLKNNSSVISSMSFQNDIELKNIGFKYVAEGPWILKDINIRIPKGSRIGILGVSGGGKSTLADVVMGLLEPTTGNFLVDGREVNSNNLMQWQKHIAHVPQSIFISDASIAENIAFGESIDSIDIENISLCAKKAQLASTIESMPEGYQTVVGERGIRLSGGQRQRLGIARALYKNADVIIFDEATSALDSETEGSVIEAINALSSDLTIFIIAHRVSTLRQCSIVLEIEGGTIVRSGCYDNIIRK